MKNKIKPGDRVQLTSEAHSWQAEHIVSVFENPLKHEFERKDYEDIAMLLLSKARRIKLKGKVLGYGAEDGGKSTRKFLHVEFYYKDMKQKFYCSRDELKKL